MFSTITQRFRSPSASNFLGHNSESIISESQLFYDTANGVPQENGTSAAPDNDSLTQEENDVLSSLQSSDQKTLLDAIDSLRNIGLSRYVSLPQLIVCGDQSSGKSSVLEAICGVKFPSKPGLCTRFATELIIRETSSVSMSINIVPGQNRSDTERRNLSAFKDSPSTLEDLKGFIEKATTLIETINGGRTFFEDILRIDIKGPNLPQLTIVDLPGLIHSNNEQISAADITFVHDMIQKYMEDRRSIILAVVSAMNDYALQAVTTLAKNVDPTGNRTLGIITKPDKLPAGSEDESGFIDLALNKIVPLRLGWHVLKNRDFTTKDTSTNERDRVEEVFFSRGICLVDNIKTATVQTRSELAKLGKSRSKLEDQRTFLVDICQSVQPIVKAGRDGLYGHAFFSKRDTIKLCAVIQELNGKFAETMRTQGHSRAILEDTSAGELSNSSQVLRKDFISEITLLLKTNRGRELPGMYNPLVVGPLFQEQSSNWKNLIDQHLGEVFEVTRQFLELAVLDSTDEATGKALIHHIIEPMMDRRYEKLMAEAVKLLMPFQKGHPITHNPRFTDTIQALKRKRLNAELTKRFCGAFGADSLDQMRGRKINAETLQLALDSHDDVDSDRYAASEALDCMEAYYRVALDSIIDNTVIYTIEGTLMDGLEDFLTPLQVNQMEGELVKIIAGESFEIREKRKELSETLSILQKSMEKFYLYGSRGTPRRPARIPNGSPAVPSNFEFTENLLSGRESPTLPGRSYQSLAGQLPSRSGAGSPAPSELRMPTPVRGHLPVSEPSPSDSNLRVQVSTSALTNVHQSRTPNMPDIVPPSSDHFPPAIVHNAPLSNPQGSAAAKGNISQNSLPGDTHSEDDGTDANFIEVF